MIATVEKILQDAKIAYKKQEEILYEAALKEFQSGKIRPGLMAKAMAQCDGDEKKAKSIYLSLLKDAIQDEMYVRQRIIDEAFHAQQRARNYETRKRAQETRKRREERKKQEESKKIAGELIDNLVNKHYEQRKSIFSRLGVLVEWILFLIFGFVLVMSYFYIQKNTESQRNTANLSNIHDSTTKPPVNTNKNIHYESKNKIKRSREDEFSRKYPDCEFKSVMTNADYYACGLQPPTN